MFWSYISEVHSEPCQTYRMEVLATILNGWNLLIIFVKRSILHVGMGSEYASVCGILKSLWKSLNVPLNDTWIDIVDWILKGIS